MALLLGPQRFGLQWQVAFLRCCVVLGTTMKPRQETWSWCDARLGRGFGQSSPSLSSRSSLPCSGRPAPPEHQQVGSRVFLFQTFPQILSSTSLLPALHRVTCVREVKCNKQLLHCSHFGTGANWKIFVKFLLLFIFYIWHVHCTYIAAHCAAIYTLSSCVLN